MIRLSAFGTLLTALWLSGCNLTGLSAAPIEGRVVDAETGEPLAGVIVVSAWRMQTGLHGQTAGFLSLDETVTDADGYFHLPGWKGKRTPAFAVVTKTSPELTFFKYGYWLGYWLNNRQHDFGSPVTRPRKSDWSGETFELNPYKDDSIKYFSVIGGIDEYYTGDASCTIPRLPLLSDELSRLNKLAKQIGRELRPFTNIDFYRQFKCGEPQYNSADPTSIFIIDTK